MKDKIKITNENGKYIISYSGYDIVLDDIVIDDDYVICYYDQDDKGFRIPVNTYLGSLMIDYLQEEVEEKNDLDDNSLLYQNLDDLYDLLTQEYLSDNERIECVNRIVIIKEMIRLFYTTKKIN